MKQGIDRTKISAMIDKKNDFCETFDPSSDFVYTRDFVLLKQKLSGFRHSISFSTFHRLKKVAFLQTEHGMKVDDNVSKCEEKFAWA